MQKLEPWGKVLKIVWYLSVLGKILSFVIFLMRVVLTSCGIDRLLGIHI